MRPSLADTAVWPEVLYTTSGICAAAMALVIGGAMFVVTPVFVAAFLVLQRTVMSTRPSV